MGAGRGFELGVVTGDGVKKYDLYMCLFIFFFQAEDGIRDHCVTGVQTCALPISLLTVQCLCVLYFWKCRWLSSMTACIRNTCK